MIYIAIKQFSRVLLIEINIRLQRVVFRVNVGSIIIIGSMISNVK